VNEHQQAVLMSSATNEWLTPADVLATVRAVGDIVLDPCSHPAAIVDAAFSIRRDLGEDGLMMGWAPIRGLVYVNPPYGPDLKAWARKIQAEAEKGAEIIACVPARVDTGWWRTMRPAAWCAWSGRVRFLRPDGAKADSAAFPSAFLYFGPNVARFVEVFSAKGRVYLEPTP